MNSQTVIDVQNVSVRFNLAKEKVDNLKEYCIKLFKGDLLFQEFFALKDVTFSVQRGESWGIIGRNGSGKSTLLKLICGILKPYQGTVTCRGSIAPLIELGAGFDGQLTARENIYLNGAILGHSRKYMGQHFDEIVHFAEIEKFVDVPIKNFSSGMKARLGFAVATTVQPEILVVDEVLSVGDKNFQNKCEERMQNMLKGGTTLIFVSHSNAAVRRLCQYALWLDTGRLIASGDSEHICEAYEKS